jgi:hypothetical protein
MEEDERERARELISQQRTLLTEVAEGRRGPDDAEAEYKQTHLELRALLAKDTLPCFCPWGSVKPWAFGGYQDWSAELDRFAAPLRELLEPEPRPAWRLVLYRRNGGPGDLPFDEEFEESLSEEKWAVLDISLRQELAVHGTALLSNGRKCHPMPCGGRRHPQPSVSMYKIKEGAPGGRAVLRVFFETAPERELETRTAQTAWSLSPSRTRWLANQIWPLVLVAGTAIVIASIASSMLHTTRINARGEASLRQRASRAR